MVAAYVAHFALPVWKGCSTVPSLQCHQLMLLGTLPQKHIAARLPYITLHILPVTLYVHSSAWHCYVAQQPYTYAHTVYCNECTYVRRWYLFRKWLNTCIQRDLISATRIIVWMCSYSLTGIDMTGMKSITAASRKCRIACLPCKHMAACGHFLHIVS